MSRAWQHRQLVLQQQAEQAAAEAAAKEQAKAPAEEPAKEEKSTVELLLQAVEIACARISAEPKGSQARNDLKKVYVAEFLPSVKAYIESGSEYKNTVMTQVMIWLFDLGRIAEAMEIARVAIAQNQPMPERFKRDIRTGVADLVLESLNAGIQEASAAFSEVYAQIFPANGPGWQIHEDIKLKYVKAAIGMAEEKGNVRKALELCEKAEAINAKAAQVKTKKAQLRKAVALLDEQAAHEAAKKK